MVMQTRVMDNPNAGQFEIEADGERVGLARYRLDGETMSITHTEIDPRVGGRGLGSTLVRGALDAARDTGLSVLPVCPFVQRYIAGHREYIDLVPAGERARYGLAIPASH